MRVVLDTNILISALMVQNGKPGRHLSRLARGVFHAPHLRGTSRRAARHAAQAGGRGAHRAL